MDKKGTKFNSYRRSNTCNDQGGLKTSDRNDTNDQFWKLMSYIKHVDGPLTRVPVTEKGKGRKVRKLRYNDLTSVTRSKDHTRQTTCNTYRNVSEIVNQEVDGNPTVNIK